MQLNGVIHPLLYRDTELEILSYLDLHSLSQVSKVSKKIKALSETDFLWKKIYLKTNGDNWKTRVRLHSEQSSKLMKDKLRDDYGKSFLSALSINKINFLLFLQFIINTYEMGNKYNSYYETVHKKFYNLEFEINILNSKCHVVRGIQSCYSDPEASQQINQKILNFQNYKNFASVLQNRILILYISIFATNFTSKVLKVWNVRQIQMNFESRTLRIANVALGTAAIGIGVLNMSEHPVSRSLLIAEGSTVLLAGIVSNKTIVRHTGGIILKFNSLISRVLECFSCCLRKR